MKIPHYFAIGSEILEGIGEVSFDVRLQSFSWEETTRLLHSSHLVAEWNGLDKYFLWDYSPWCYCLGESYFLPVTIKQLFVISLQTMAFPPKQWEANVLRLLAFYMQKYQYYTLSCPLYMATIWHSFIIWWSPIFLIDKTKSITRLGVAWQFWFEIRASSDHPILNDQISYSIVIHAAKMSTRPNYTEFLS